MRRHNKYLIRTPTGSHSRSCEATINTLFEPQLVPIIRNITDFSFVSEVLVQVWSLG